MQRSLEDCKRGRGQLILVGGEPGIGKSRLMRELAVWAREHGIVVGTGAAYEGESAGSFGPVVEVLRSLRRLSHPDHDALTAGLAAISSTDEDAGDGERARWQMFETVADGLASVAQRDSACLIITEDLHWADDSTFALLREHARGRRRVHRAVWYHAFDIHLASAG